MLLSRSDLAEIVVNKPVIDGRTDLTRPPTGVVDLATGTYRPIVPDQPLTTWEKVAVGVGVVGLIGLAAWLVSRAPRATVVYDDSLYGSPVVVRRRRPVVIYEDEPTVVVDEAPSLLVNPRKKGKKPTKKPTLRVLPGGGSKTKKSKDPEIEHIEELRAMVEELRAMGHDIEERVDPVTGEKSYRLLSDS